MRRCATEHLLHRVVTQNRSNHYTNAENPKTRVDEFVDSDCLCFVEMQKISKNHSNQPAYYPNVCCIDESGESPPTE